MNVIEPGEAGAMADAPAPDPPAGSPAAAMLQPGLIWACARAGGGELRLNEDGEPPAGAGFRWLHLNLADQRSHRWIERGGLLPPAARALFLGHELAQRPVVADGAIALVVHDFEREFDRLETGRIGALRVAIAGEVMLTGRYHALRSADLVRQRILGGAPLDRPIAALDLVLSSVIDTIASRVADIASELLAAEDELVAGAEAAETRELVTLRRLCTRLHRITGELLLTMRRLQAEPAAPDELGAVARRCADRLTAIDGDIASAQGQLRLLRDELDLRAAQRTNQNIYMLSILTALMMPATLVTGFFGMNTGGLPLASGGGDTVVATVVAVAASAGTYLALKAMGLTRR